jgi:hypothetical protein
MEKAVEDKGKTRKSNEQGTAGFSAREYLGW